MTRIDFYILAEKARGDKFELACRLAEKAYLAGQRVCITTENDQDATQVNQLLWTYSQQSFIPHQLDSEQDIALSPVMISSQLQQTDEHQVLINLASEVPACFSQFDRLLEPVDHNDDNKFSGRKRYRYYRDCGYTINNHEIKR